MTVLDWVLFYLHSVLLGHAVGLFQLFSAKW